jgi:undecaprenyl-diphosphatase
VGAFVIFWVERKAKGKQFSETITWGVVFAIAAGQILAAIFPGTSRSGAAIMAALMLGLSRPVAVYAAFLVGIPTMFAAGGYKLLGAVKDGHAAELLATPSIVAFVVATLAAWLSVKWLLKFVQTSTFIPFAWYRVGLGVLLLALVGAGVLR